MNRLFIIGAGGLGRDVLAIAKAINAHALLHQGAPEFEICGFLDDNPDVLAGLRCSHAVVGSIQDFEPKPGDRFAMAIAGCKAKEAIALHLLAKGAVFTAMIHPTAIIGETAEIGQGLIMNAYSNISENTKIGDFVTVLAKSSIGHDAVLGDYCTVSPLSHVTGGVKFGTRVFMGSHATIVPKRKVGDDAYLAAGTAVFTNVRSGAKMIGNPAKKMDI